VEAATSIASCFTQTYTHVGDLTSILAAHANRVAHEPCGEMITERCLSPTALHSGDDSDVWQKYVMCGRRLVTMRCWLK